MKAKSLAALGATILDRAQGGSCHLQDSPQYKVRRCSTRKRTDNATRSSISLQGIPFEQTVVMIELGAPNPKVVHQSSMFRFPSRLSI